MATRIYTKTGDRGDTGLFGGQRVSKDHVRVEAYGAVDELNAFLGAARTASPPADLDAWLAELQSLLFELGGDLATPPDRRKRPAAITDADVTRLEGLIDAGEAELTPMKSFILPGGTPLAAALHVARVVCRRAERRVVTLRQSEPQTSPLTVTVLNRLSDLLFVLARLANARAGRADIPWQPRDRRP